MLMQIEVQGRALPFWKPPINIFKEPDCHGCCSALNVYQAMLKIVYASQDQCTELYTPLVNRILWKFQCIESCGISADIPKFIFVFQIALLWDFQRGRWLFPSWTGLEMLAGHSWKCRYEVKLRGFLHFQLWQAAISKTSELGIYHITLQKAQSTADKWKQK